MRSKERGYRELLPGLGLRKFHCHLLIFSKEKCCFRTSLCASRALCSTLLFHIDLHAACDTLSNAHARQFAFSFSSSIYKELRRTRSTVLTCLFAHTTVEETAMRTCAPASCEQQPDSTGSLFDAGTVRRMIFLWICGRLCVVGKSRIV